MDDITEKLAGFAADFRSDTLGPAMVETVCDHILDAFGCALAGMDEAPARIVRELAIEAEPARGGVSLIGSSVRVTPDWAAFANGVAGRCLDYNDTFNGARTGGHPSDMLSAILAASEAANLPGRAVVDGMFLAYEIFGALAEEVPLREYATDQGAILSVAVACAIAATQGFTKVQAANAISLALTTTMPLRASRSGELSAWKGCATAHSAAGAIMAARLAQRGMEGPPNPFRGVDGFLQRIPVDIALDTLGRPRDGKSVIERTSFKFLPVEFGAQAPVELFLKLSERIGPDDIVSIDVGAYEFLYKEIGGGRNDAKEKWDPQTRETADHSLPYILAVVLADRDISLASFAPERVRDPALRPIMNKISVRVDPATKTMEPTRQPVTFRIALKDGTVIEETCEYALGHHTKPGTRADVRAKFDRLAASVLDRDATKRLAEAIYGLASAKDLGDLTATLRAASAHLR